MFSFVGGLAADVSAPGVVQEETVDVIGSSPLEPVTPLPDGWRYVVRLCAGQQRPDCWKRLRVHQPLKAVLMKAALMLGMPLLLRS